MSNQTKTDIHKKAMIEALQKSLGIVTQACKMVDIARATHYEWYNTDPEYKKDVDDVEDMAIDFAESKLHKQIEEKNTTATIFYLKTKGKKRGYIERQEIDMSGNLNLATTPDSVETLLKTFDAISAKSKTD